MRDKILIERRLLEIDNPSKNAAYLSAKLYNQFGIIVDKPMMLSKNNVETVADFYSAKIPEGFYKNPQDLTYFSTDELIIEQLVSYFQIAMNGEKSLDEEVFKRNEVFAKALPNYSAGKEIKLRKYELISKEEADNKLLSIVNDLCKYTRPWSEMELSEFKWLYLNGFYNEQYLLCRDNAISLFLEYKNEYFAKMLDKKDIVKMSLNKFGYQKKLDFSDDDKTIFALAIKNAKDCALSLSQAKRFNAIIRKVGISIPKSDNSKSPYKKALKLLSQKDVIGAAKTLANSGSLLERNLVFLLSRASFEEGREIVNMVKSDNPIVLIQLLLGIINDDYSKSREFKFYFNKRLKSHTETEKEHQFRKSVLSLGIKNFLIDEFNKKIKSYYESKPSLGKIYIADHFKNVALPLNTSAMGQGLDVLPTGSRLKINAEYVRAFCYWYNAFDIDASVAFIKDKDDISYMYWGNYSKMSFGKSALCSGDCRAKDGAEFCDFRIDELKELGYKYAVFTLNGYGSQLDHGEIYCGYQNKNNLDTAAWDPKNIELKINVKGDSRGYVGFALDFENNEIVILNQVLVSNRAVVNSDMIKSIDAYLNRNYVTNFNMYKLLSYRGQIVNNKEEADVIFDDNYIAKDGQTVISSFNIEKLISLLK
ncbi:MAG: hypothetical protein IKQ31_03595 [Clostridia bacterium]|nr:hypothetical protein [Clostridia bacterium]